MLTDRFARYAEHGALSWSPWRMVVGFGMVSLAADMVYEGARSVTGPLLAALGASAVLVGVVTGAGEAIALLLRLVSGSWADRSGRYWTLTFVGYALTVVCVPALAVAPFLGAGGLAVACVLILAERTGKAVRSPAKSALLAQAAASVGMGRGMAVHKVLDQLGAVAGPLIVAAAAAVTGGLWPALALLAVPGAFALLMLAVVRLTMHGSVATGSRQQSADTPGLGDLSTGRLPRAFWLFAAAAGAASAGLVTFGVISYHLSVDHVLPLAAVPLVYAAAMGAEALAALGTGLLYERIKGRVLLALPFLIAAVPVIAFSSSATIAVVGVLIWGAAMGIQDSTVKALVADLVPAGRRATAYGLFAAVQGGAAVAGGAMAGALYERSRPALIAAVCATQIAALVLLSRSLRSSREV